MDNSTWVRRPGRRRARGRRGAETRAPNRRGAPGPSGAWPRGARGAPRRRGRRARRARGAAARACHGRRRRRLGGARSREASRGARPRGSRRGAPRRGAAHGSGAPGGGSASPRARSARRGKTAAARGSRRPGRRAQVPPFDRWRSRVLARSMWPSLGRAARTSARRSTVDSRRVAFSGELRRPRAAPVGDGLEQRVVVAAREEEPARRALCEGDAEGPDVRRGPRAGPRAEADLGSAVVAARDVRGRVGAAAVAFVGGGPRFRGQGEDPAAPKVDEDAARPRRVEDDVVRLHVEVGDAARVDVRERGGEVPRDDARQVERHAPKGRGVASDLSLPRFRILLGPLVDAPQVGVERLEDEDPRAPPDLGQTRVRRAHRSRRGSFSDERASLGASLERWIRVSRPSASGSTRRST